MSRVVDEVIGRHWPGQVLHVRPLPGGITNSNFLVDLAGRSLVLRVPGKDTDLLGIERRSEVLAQGLAAAAGVAAALILVDRPTGCLVSGFVPGRQVPPPELAAEPMLGHLAETIRTVQHCGRVPAVFDPLAMIRRYHRCAEQRGVAEPFDYAGQLALVERFRDRRAFSPTVLGHNDLLTGNIIYDGSLRLIDWEYAGMTDPYFDLANVSANHDFPLSSDKALLERYFGECDDARLATLVLMKMVSELREAMWGVVQTAISDLEVDFASYAGDHGARFEALRAGVDVDDLLALTGDPGPDPGSTPAG